LQAAEELEKAGISAEVIDLRSLRPFDVAAVADSVKKTNRIVSSRRAGVCRHRLRDRGDRHGRCFDWLDAPLKRVAGKDVPFALCRQSRTPRGAAVEDIVARRAK